MPNKETFKIRPIADLLREEGVGEGVWIDPFAGNSIWATVTNDLNPETTASSHLDAMDFLKTLEYGSADGALYDPPYSTRQLKECYSGVGMAVTGEMTRSDWWSRIKQEIGNIVKPGGKVISCGWNSGGIGMFLGFHIERILLVAHGGIHNDTICVVETRRK